MSPHHDPRVVLQGSPAPATPAQVEDYLTERLVHEPEVLRRVREASAAAGLPDVAVTPAQGKLLALLIRLAGARRILEIGTLGGYSAAWMLSALPHDGHLHSLEVNREHARVARENLRLVDPEGEGTRWNVEVGPAVKSLHQLTWNRLAPFDLVFIDADKASNRVYLEWALRLTAPGSVVVLDNVVRAGGVVLDPNETAEPENIHGVRDALELLHQDLRFDATALQTVSGKGWDGFALALVTAEGAPGSVAGTVRVEPMSEQTVRAAVSLKNAGWRETFESVLSEDWLDAMDTRLESDIAAWAASLRRPGNLQRTAVAVTADGQVIGMASAAPVLEESDRLATGAKWELFTLYVARTWQGSGVAKRLADAVLGDEPALLWVWEDNPRAHRFFEKMGFEPDGAREALPEEWNGAHDVRMVRRS